MEIFSANIFKMIVNVATLKNVSSPHLYAFRKIVGCTVEDEIYWSGINESDPPTDVLLFTSHL